MRSVFAQLLQGQAEIKQQLADLQRQCSQVGGKWVGGRGGGGVRVGERGSSEGILCVSLLIISAPPQ